RVGTRPAYLTAPVTLGVAVVAGSVCPSAHAEEFSFAPSFTWSLDESSNPLLLQDGETSGSAIMVADLPFQRATESTQIRITPHVRLQRFTDPALGNNDDFSMHAQLSQEFERGQLSAGAQYADTSTLTTERDETGILERDSHRRTAQADFSPSY